jgi:hypothetical protein
VSFISFEFIAFTAILLILYLSAAEEASAAAAACFQLFLYICLLRLSDSIPYNHNNNHLFLRAFMPIKKALRLFA